MIIFPGLEREPCKGAMRKACRVSDAWRYVGENGELPIIVKHNATFKNLFIGIMDSLLKYLPISLSI